MDAKVCSKLDWYLHKKGINICVFFAVFLLEKKMYPHVARKEGQQAASWSAPQLTAQMSWPVTHP